MKTKIVEKIISGEYVSIFSDKKFDYEFILADKNAVFVLPVINNKQIMLRLEPIAAYHYYDNQEEIEKPENLDKNYALLGGGIEKPIEELMNLSREEYIDIALENAERECYEEGGIKLNDGLSFKFLYQNGKIKNIGPIFSNKYNSHKVNYLLVFLDEEEFELKKPPTDGTEIEKLSKNVLLDIDSIDFNSFIQTADLGIALLMTELENYLKLEFKENKYIEEIKHRIMITENTNSKLGLIVGRFQPFTTGHLLLIRELYSKIKTTIVIGIVEGSLSSKNKDQNPLTFQQRADLIKKVLEKTNIPYVILKFNSGYLPDALSVINNSVGDFELLYMSCGTDRMKDYTRLLDKAKEEFNFEYELIELKRTDADISASKVRDAIKSNDFVFYSENTPPGINDEATFEKLKGILLFNN